MNFLAHAFLAGDAPADRLGGVMGDFVKGTLPAGLPRALAEGVRLHRRIDSFADRHAAFIGSRARVSAVRRRVAGVMIDMFYDHFLALHWSRFHPEPLEQFAARTYTLMAAHYETLPPRLAALLPRMRDENWLSAYRSVEIIGQALDRMSARLQRSDLLHGSGAELLDHYSEFEADFFAFLPDATAFAQRVRQERSRDVS